MSEVNLTGFLQGKKILVVEDEPDSLEVASILLEMYGADVITATNGREGLDQARKHQPRFIISDLSMPEMSGWEMVHHLKDDRSTMDIPVVALTAHAMTGDRERALAAGFHNYLSKPLRPDTFINDLMKLVADSPELMQTLTEEN
ncbi:MAG: response regulator [Chloroflexi bacterium]|nr:response regulator [Chloroflexota bacterium]